MDVVDCKGGHYLRSISGLPGVAGVLVSNEKDLVFTSNRGEETVGVFAQKKDSNVEKVKIGGRPNGLAFNPSRGMLLAANVAGPQDPGSVTASIVDVNEKVMVADVKVPGRTRWTVYDPESDRFYVNIASPPQIAVIDGEDPDGLARSLQIPSVGPHGLDLDVKGRRLFCACDDGGLYEVDLESNRVSNVAVLAGQPDVIFHNSSLGHLYVAIGDPGIIQVFDTEKAAIAQTLETEVGTHTIAFDHNANKVYAFMPESHRASIFVDE